MKLDGEGDVNCTYMRDDKHSHPCKDFNSELYKPCTYNLDVPRSLYDAVDGDNIDYRRKKIEEANQ